jgi:uncharacterized protein YjbI with pentapeptide repeats
MTRGTAAQAAAANEPADGPADGCFGTRLRPFWRTWLMPVLAFAMGAQPAFGGDLLGPEGVVIKPDPQALSARDVTVAVVKAGAGHPIDFSGRNLRDLDLSGLDFHAARLAGSDLFGADLTSSNLTGVDLSNGNLNRTIVIRADFSGANLHNVTFMRPSVSTSLEYDVAEAPKFAGADMRNIRMTGKMVGADFRGANLTGARLGPHEPRADISSMPASILKSCDFSGALLTDVDLSRAILTFSRFVGADLRRVSFVAADLSMADLSGADLTGSDLTGANLDGANLAGVKGFETVRGRDTIKNLDRALR